MSGPHLDHIIFLLPYTSLLSLPDYFTDNFTITPGGRHAHNETENKLICFADGSYIELIAFINDDPKLKEGHWWGKKKPGVIDFAFTHSDGDAAVHFSELEERLEKLDTRLRIIYQKPVKGGRKRPDGVDVKWEVTFPVVRDEDSGEEGYQRGELPFWCHDVTPREVRVPFSKESTTHPCGSTGVSELHIFVPDARVEVLLKAYEAILGAKKEGDTIEVASLRTVEGRNGTKFVVSKPREKWQREAMEARGGYLIAGLGLGARKGEKETRIDGGDGEFGVGGLFV